MSQTENTRRLVQQYLRFLAERNLEKVIGLFDEKVDWFIPGNQNLAPWLGKRDSKNEISVFFQTLWDNTETVSAKIEHLLTEDNFAVVTGEFSTKMIKTGKIFDSIFSIHITIENNRIVRYRLQEDSYALVAALT